MTNEELKKKIAQIIADYFCPQRNEHKFLWGNDRLCYSKTNFAECERVAECTDALIAAWIGDVKEAKVHEAEHRAEAADIVISELRAKLSKAKHDRDRYARRITRLQAENAALRERLDKAIELPCIEPMTTWDWDDTTGCGKSNFGKYWQILYRDVDGEFIDYIGATKEEAEKRLAELKGEKE